MSQTNSCQPNALPPDAAIVAREATRTSRLPPWPEAHPAEVRFFERLTLPSDAREALKSPVLELPVFHGFDVAPLVSVLMPVRNAAETLPHTLECVLRQRGVSFECVAVDDGSTDESPSLLSRAAMGDPRLRVIQGPARGIVAALNVGLSECRGEFIARMDADDLMRGDRLLLQARALEADTALEAVGCHVRMFPRSRLSPRRRAYEAWLNSLESELHVARDAFVECPLAHPTLMLRRRALEAFPYRDRGWPEDYDLVLRLLTAGRRLGVVPRRLLAWRDGPSRLSRTCPSYSIPRFVECKAEFLALSFLRSGPSYILWGYGDTGRTLAKALAQHDKHPCAIVEVHPGRLGQRIRSAAVIPPAQLLATWSCAGRPPIVASVAGSGPRGEIRDALRGFGFEEGLDFVCAA